ncbi:FK506-binding protein 4 [Elsinoe australis]|uniref:peptidylprolyl isomerase n=1 Tax=Elsinoe australis TaxID=40998 RepID=A0A2P7ZDB5_9PEZI|nr:FK506-binding protein 4 [Elsinoe australis]
MSTLPMAVFGLEVPAGMLVPATVDIPASFTITMAAIDPSEEPEESAAPAGSKPRATLKLIRQPLLADDYDDDDSDFDSEAMDRLLAEGDSEEESEDDEEVNGGPSDPSKSKKARKAAAVAALIKSLKEDGDEDEEMDVDAPNGVNGKVAKGKGKATDIDEEEDHEDEEDSDDEEGFEPEEFVLCTLDPEQHYQQPLNITIGEDEQVWFQVSGTHTVYLTGNYVEPADNHRDDYDDEDSEDYDSDEYDLTPDEDEIDDEDELSEDELDDLPRVTEVASEDEEVPELVAPKKGKDAKGKNKRPAEDEATTLDDMISQAQTNGETKLSKKQAKKLKNNEGKAVEKEEPSSAKSDKKVSFAEKLETGPTPSPSAAKDKSAATGPRVVGGVTVDVKKVGEGDEAKKGDRVGMRYIGKLQKDGKVFDSNKKGKPFSFKLGIGEVIKGWDVGVAGMRVGGERRLTVPAHLGYGSKGTPGIPPNSTLIFDIKCVSISKK